MAQWILDLVDGTKLGPWEGLKEDARQAALRQLDSKRLPKGSVLRKMLQFKKMQYTPPYKAITARERWPGGDPNLWMVIDSLGKFRGHADDEAHANEKVKAWNQGRVAPPSKFRENS